MSNLEQTAREALALTEKATKVYSFGDIISKQNYPKAYSRSFVVVEKYNELNTMLPALAQGYLDLLAENKAISGLREMDIKQCMRMNDEIAKLKSDREKLIEALKFYTDGNGIEEEDIEQIKDAPWGDKYCYGKKARATLAELGIK